jgi:hypothetical protein
MNLMNQLTCCLQFKDLLLDYSKNKIDDAVLALLLRLVRPLAPPTGPAPTAQPRRLDAHLAGARC